MAETAALHLAPNAVPGQLLARESAFNNPDLKCLSFVDA
jgi:hypothetical protein